VVPVLIYSDVDKAIQWLCQAFGFMERLRAERDGVVSHAQLAVGDGAVMLGRQGGPYRAPEGGLASPQEYLKRRCLDAALRGERGSASAHRVRQACRISSVPPNNQIPLTAHRSVAGYLGGHFRVPAPKSCASYGVTSSEGLPQA
jgi:hypothetical protein